MDRGVRTPRAIHPAWALYVAFIGLGLGRACLGPTLPAFAEQAGVDIARIGLLLVLRSLGGLGGTLLSGWAVDAGWARAFVGSALVVMAVQSALVPVLGTFAPLAIAFFAVGLSQGSLDAGGNSILLRDAGPTTNVKLSALHFFYGGGVALAPLLVAWTLGLRADGTAAYWVIALFMLVPLGLWLRAPGIELPRRPSLRIPGTAGWPLGFTGLALLLFFSMGAEVSLGSWIFTHAGAAGMGTASAAILTSGFGVSYTLGRLVLIRLSRNVHPSRLATGGLIGSIAASIALAAAPTSIAMLWAGVMLAGASVSVVFPQTLAWARSQSPVSARHTSAFMVVSCFGAMSFPWLTGWLLDRSPLRALPLVLIATLSAALLVAAWVWRTDRRRSTTG